MKLCLASLVLIAAIACLGRDAWLLFLGQYLVDSSGESKSSADVVVVPAADYIRPDVGMEALEEAVRLQRAGSVKRIVMSCKDSYGVSECELAETALRKRGYLGSRIEWLRTDPLPDEMEADKVIRWLKERGAKSAIILLPNYKTRRLGGVYKKLGRRSGIEASLFVQRSEFNPQKWWRSREGQMRFLEEIARFTGIL